MRALCNTRAVADLLNAEAATFPGVEFSTWFAQGEEVVEPETSSDVVRAFGKVLYGPENVYPGFDVDLPPGATVGDIREPLHEAEYTLEVFIQGRALASLYEPILDGARLVLVRAGVQNHTFEGPSASDLSESIHSGFSAVAVSFTAFNG